VLTRNIALATLTFMFFIPAADAQVGGPSCRIAALPNECSTPNRPHSLCRVEALGTLGARCPLGLLATVMGFARASDYTYSTYTDYLQVDDGTFLVLAEKKSPSMSQILESRLGGQLFPGRSGNAVQNGWTPLSQFYARYVEVKGDALCLTLGAAYPFAGSLRQCTDGTTASTIRTADGVPTWDEARTTAANLLFAKFQLDVTNAEHLEVKQPQLDAKLMRGDWHFVLRYEGRRREQPYWTYVVAVPLVGQKEATISRQPWP